MAEEMAVMPDEPAEAGNYGAGFEALGKCIQAAFVAMILLIAAMFVWMFLDGFFYVRPQEEVILLRFGKFHAAYTENWHWSFPYPIDQIVRVPKSKLKVSTFHFWPRHRDKAFDEEPMADIETGPLVVGKDGYLLTGDANIMHSRWILNYHIGNAKKYYERCLCPDDPMKADEDLIDPRQAEKTLGTRGPRTLLINLLENSVLEITARELVDDALYKDSFRYMKTVEEHLLRKLNDLDIGVVLDSVILESKTVPGRTLAAFGEVIAAEQDSSRLQKEAQRYQVESVNSAEARATRIIAEAEAYKKQAVAEIQSETAYFDRIYKECRENSEIVLATLFHNTLSEIVSRIERKFVIRNNPDGFQEVRLLINPEPTPPTTPEKGDRP